MTSTTFVLRISGTFSLKVNPKIVTRGGKEMSEDDLRMVFIISLEICSPSIVYFFFQIK